MINIFKNKRIVSMAAAVGILVILVAAILIIKWRNDNKTSVSTSVAKNEAVNFDDENLEKFIRYNLILNNNQFTEGDTVIYKSYLESMDTISFRPDLFAQRGYTDTAGEELKQIFDNGYELDLNKLVSYCPNINNIDLYGVKVSNFDAVIKLRSLQSLDINNSNIENIDAIGTLDNLTDISFSGNAIADIKALSSLDKLTYVDLSSNKIEDISPMSGLANIWELSLDNNKITDCTPLKNMTHLNTLSIINNPIKDFSPLDNLKNAEIKKSK